MRLKVPVGIDDFSKIREKAFLYVDKSLFIEEVLDQSAETLLILRPRRFGKTLNLSMLDYFFDCGKQSATLFDGLAIAKRPCFAEQGSWPVVFLTLKGLKFHNYDVFLQRMASLMSSLFGQYKYLLERLDNYDRLEFERFLTKQATEGDLMDGLLWLTNKLHEYQCLDQALAQIKEQNYAEALESAGVHQKTEIAVVFYGKQVAVRAIDNG